MSDRRIGEIEARLRRAYGSPRHHNPLDPLDDLIFLVLSRMTQEVKYLRTYKAVREEFPTWEAVLHADSGELERVLDDAGLARTKSRHIQAILKEVEAREGRLDLQRLRSLPDHEIEEYLTSLPGVAAKTALCVMLYSLGRETFPVDAHVWRIAVRLGLAEDAPWSEAESRELERSVPPELRGSLHVTLIAHGRSVCLARVPKCGGCILEDLCPSVNIGSSP